MHLYLSFAQGAIRGEGTDYVGPWTIEGRYDAASGDCQWIKQYLGKHQVAYSGTSASTGIEGTWSIQGWLRGRFHIWPADNAEMHEFYARHNPA